jgi:hypothetical protein
MRRSWTAILVVAAVISLFLKMFLALETYGTNDVLFWEADIEKIQSDGGIALYRDGAQLFHGTALYHTEPFNQPPFTIALLKLWRVLAEVSGEPLRFWLRITGSVADLWSLFFVSKTLTASGLRVPPTGLLLMALSPASIMISGFHGNTDAIMMCFLLLSIYLATLENVLLSGLTFGAAVSIKIAPVIFLPVIMLSLPSRKLRIQYAMGAGAVFLAGALPYALQDPPMVVRSVFAYSPAPGDWGFWGILQTLVHVGRRIGVLPKMLALAVVAIASFRINRSSRKPSLFAQCGFVAFLFLFVTPGFGVQYLAWLVPWIALGVGPSLFCYLASGAFLFGFYTFWSKGLPWFLANTVIRDSSDLPGTGLPLLRILEMVCWISVGLAAWAHYRSFFGSASKLGNTSRPIRGIRAHRSNWEPKPVPNRRFPPDP